MKHVRMVLSVVALFALVAGLHAADAQKKVKKGAGVAGKVEKVDSEAKTITIVTQAKKKKDPNAKPETITVAVNDQTKFTVQTADGTKDGKLADVATGKVVQIAKETKDGKEVATAVTIREGKKKNK